MERMKLDLPLSEEEKQHRQHKLAAILKSRDIQRFLKEHQLEADFIEKNLSFFDDYLRNLKKCRSCQGLEFCVQPFKGKACRLEIDESGFLDERYVTCKYKKAQQRRLAFTGNFLVKHGDPGDFQIDLAELGNSDSTQYLNCFTRAFTSLEPDHKGLYLYGVPGVGKTYLMLALANEFARQKKTVAFVQVPQLVSDLKEEMSNGDYRQELMGKLRRADVLFLDDIGAESITRWSRSEVLLPLIDWRLARKKKTYFTSNYSLEELNHQYVLYNEVNGKIASLRLLERIRALADEVLMEGSSRR